MKKLILLLVLMMCTAGWGATYYVSTTGNDSAPTDGTAANAYNTIAEAITACAASGDTISVFAGTYDQGSSVLTSTGKGIVFQAHDAALSVIIATTGSQGMLIDSNTTVDGFSITTTALNAIKVGIGTGKVNVTIRNCALVSADICLYAPASSAAGGTTNLIVENTTMEGRWYGLGITFGINCIVRNCSINRLLQYADSIHSLTGVLVAGTVAFYNCPITFYNNDDAQTVYIAGVIVNNCVGRTVSMYNCPISVHQDNAGCTTEVDGVHAITGANLFMSNCPITLVNDGSGATYDFWTTGTAVVKITNVVYDPTRVSGTITDYTNKKDRAKYTGGKMRSRYTRIGG